MPYPTNLVVGTDGITPIYEPHGVWKIWGLHEIFTGHQGDKKYVPKVHDYVIDYETNRAWIVVSIDTTTMLAELKEIEGGLKIKTLQIKDPLIADYRLHQNHLFFVYLDTSVSPYTLTVDRKHSVYGSMAHHAQIFRGTKLNNTQEVVSMIYDQYGHLVSQSIPLEKAEAAGFTNYAVWSIPPCHTTVDMPDGEIVTVVVYNDLGGVVSIDEMIIVNTGAIRQVDTSVKYITDISLESPYMTEHDPTLMKYPLNVPVRGLNLFGVVHYSDGSKRRLPVDGTKFSVLGLRDYVSTIVGYRTDFDLRYTIGRDEIATNIRNDTNIDMSILGDKFITKHYRGETVEPDNAYNVKLFGYPKWIDDLNGYRMEFFLLNLERSFCIDVTNYVHYNQNRIPFNGLLYGQNQRLSISINLKEANITNKDYIHTQVMDIQLQRNGGDKTGYPWSIGFEVNQFPYYGIDNFAHLTTVNQNLKRINISLDETRYDTWLERIWKRTKPLYDELREGEAPEPNYFKILTPRREFEFPISRWNQQLEINDVLDVTDNIYVVFFKRTNDTDLFVGISGLPLLPV